MHKKIPVVIRLAVLLSALLTASLTSYAELTDTRALRLVLADSVRQTMAHINNPADSIIPLYNIFDLTYVLDERANALKQLTATARRCGKTGDALTAATYLARIWANNIDTLHSLSQRLDDYPESKLKAEAKLFIDMLIIDYNITHDNEQLTPEEQDRQLSELIRQLNSDTPGNNYQQIKTLYTLCLGLAKATRGELLAQYARELEDLIERMSLSTGSVRNLVFTRTARLYTETGRIRRAIEADKKMLNVIDSLRTHYESNGRPFRTLAVNRYNCYRRLLSNYKALTPYEVDKYYRAAQTLAQQVDVINADFNEFERPTIYYNLAKGNYREAITAIKRQIDKPELRDKRPYFLRALVEASEAIGDTQTQLESALELNRFLIEQLDNRSDDSYRELQLRYDLETYKAEVKARREKQEAEHHQSIRLFIAGLCVAVAALFIMAILLVRKNRKVKRTSEQLLATAERMKAERNQLRQTQQALVDATQAAERNINIKTEFIHNMCHEVQAPLKAISEYSQLIIDCIPAEQKKYLNRIAIDLDKNVSMVLTLVNDVLDMAALEHGKTTIMREPSSVQEICELAINNIFARGAYASKDLTVTFNPDQKADISVDTDSQRLTQILMNLLSNAAKFTEHGSITVDYDDRGDAVDISVSDTGIGIPEELEEKIFDRFYQIDPKSQGSGLGLYISRLVATLLEGSISVEHIRLGGSKFTVTIPK